MANAIGYGMLNNVDFMGDCYDLEGIFQIYVSKSTCSMHWQRLSNKSKSTTASELRPKVVWHMFNPIIVAKFPLIPFR